MYIHEVEPQMDRLKFWYLVPHLPSRFSEASPFQLISPGIFQTCGAFRLIASMPRDVVDLVRDSRELVEARIAGRGHSVIPVEIEYLESALTMLSAGVIVVVSMTSELAKLASVAIGHAPQPILHITPREQLLNRQRLRNHCLKVAKYWDSQKIFPNRASIIRSSLAKWVDPLITRKLGFMRWNHLLVDPNFAVLASAGYEADPWDGKPIAAMDNAPYFEALRGSVNPIMRIRQETIDSNPSLAYRSRCDLIVTVPSVLKFWSSPDLDWSKIGDSVARNRIRRLLRHLAARETYSFTGTREELKSGILLGLLKANRDDLDVYTAALSVRAASNFVPVLRLPTWANGARPEFSQLASACRGSIGKSPHKLNRLARALSRRLGIGMPEWIKDLIRGAEQIKLVADAPLEWLELDGFPLMLRSDVSRIPVTPGNLFVEQVLELTDRALPAAAFQDVLVIRAFQDDDPIKPMLERAISLYTYEPSMRIRIEDVRNRKQLVDVLNSFQGAILVFDGHGRHQADRDVGELVLVDEVLDPMSLRAEARVPPIVILAACDTHPFDGSHATAANGFFIAGARTVVATSVPVGGFEAAAFVGRLLLRVREYLPLLISARPWGSFRWSEIVPGLQRRQFVSEALRRLSNVGGLQITGDQFYKTIFDVGMAIDTGKDWISLFIEQVAALGGSSPDAAKERILKNAAFVDSLVFTQLGNPELVVGYGEGKSPP